LNFSGCKIRTMYFMCTDKKKAVLGDFRAKRGDKNK